MKMLFNIAAVIAAIVSAALWFWSAAMKVNYEQFGSYGGVAPGVLVELKKQSALNRWAAAATGVSALLGAIGNAWPG